MRWMVIGLFAVMAATPALGAALNEGEAGVVSSVLDGDTFILGNGLEVQLIGIEAPRLPSAAVKDSADKENGFSVWPLAPESQDTLTALLDGRSVQLSYGGNRRDRYDRALAQVHRADGTWIQGEMIARGMARVYGFQDNRTCLTELLALEKLARNERRGIWNLNWYRPRDPETIRYHVNSFQIVEGRVLAADDVRGRVFLNFGSDWKTDFTATVSSRDRKIFLRDDFDLLSLQDRPIRVRGWVTWFNGPNLEITHPEQIEILDVSDADSPKTTSPCASGPLI